MSWPSCSTALRRQPSHSRPSSLSVTALLHTLQLCQVVCDVAFLSTSYMHVRQNHTVITRWLTELAEKMAVQKSHVGETRHCCVLACWLHDEMCLWQVERVTSWLVSWVPIVLRLVANYTFFAFMYGWQEGHCALCHLSQEVFLNASKNYSASHLPAVIALNT